MKFRLRVSCQFEARSEARPEADVRVLNCETSAIRFALVSSSSRLASMMFFISVRIAFCSSSRCSVGTSADTEKSPGD